MATLAFAAAGAAIGGTLLPAGVSVLGATLSGAALGSQIGAMAGSLIDQALFAPSGRTRALQGPRLADLRVTTSTEGAPIPRVYGRARIGGQVIWATDFEEEVITTSSEQAGGVGKGGGGASASGAKSTTTEYRYYANFAVGLCEGEISGLGRVWADGTELDLSSVTMRVYQGHEDQEPDSLIVARLGEGGVPAYRGLAYIVFERLALASFGNRLPQLSFEVFRAVDELRDLVRGVVLIPGAGEFVYDVAPIAKVTGEGAAVAENVHTRQGATDLVVALDQLESALPAADTVSLVTCWFGTDLRAGHCEIRPGVEIADKITTPSQWSVGGMSRAEAHVVSTNAGRPAYGGTPSDASLIAAVGELKSRGFRVTLTPFVLMDIPDDNTAFDPYSGSIPQPSYPWRGRITLDPAPGRMGSPDKTAAAAAQISSFVGTAAVGDFATVSSVVTYVGPQEWSYRRFILHNAYLAKAAGGVDAFIIGSELRGLTQSRDGSASYPFVDALAALAADVKAILGPSTKVTYAADWTEYSGHRPQDGSGDVVFNLDPLWASPSIDAIGIDYYAPLADWRDGRLHADYMAGARSPHDLAYLKAGLRGGEDFDWYYASPADRDAQVRTSITDGLGKPWIYRSKDIRGWWENAHFNRLGGVESSVATAWMPQSKPVWLMEIGCPAVDKGANEPNVFVDPKSSESALPRYSRGFRDDLVQRRLVQAIVEGLDPQHPRALPGANPISTVYGAPMIDPARIHVYAWDARPHPAFPADEAVWGDAPNWRLGHWLNGRLAGAPLAEAVDRVLRDMGFSDHDASALVGTVPGFVIDRIMSAREALQPLELAYFFDALESNGRIVFRHRGIEPAVLSATADDLVETRSSADLVTLTRGQETDLPAVAKITYLSSEGDYRQAVIESRRLVGASGRVAQAELPLVLESFQAGMVADAWLHEAWAARERATLALPPSALALEPGDTIALAQGTKTKLLRVTEIGDHGIREVEALAVDPDVYGGLRAAPRPATLAKPPLIGAPSVELIDLPLIRGDEPETAGYVAAYQSPWPGGVALYRSPENTGFTLAALVEAAATMGTLLDPLPPGPTSRIDRGARVRVVLLDGELSAVTRLQMLSGRNLAVIRNAVGAWEVLQFEKAELVGLRTYALSGLLRGLAGTDGALAAATPAGARLIVLNSAIARLPLRLDDLRLALRWKAGPASRDIGDPAFIERTHALQGLGLRPYSPVHVRGRRNGMGDLEITWIRRTRIGGDGWESAEVPLAEDTEAYEVDVLDGDTVLRTLRVSTPSVVYSAADQLADFGALQSTVAVGVRQMSAVYGAGLVRSAVV